MEPQISEIAQRIRGLREMLELSPAELADAAGVTEQEYLTLEEGKQDFSFTFLYRVAKRFKVDMIELLTGENPHLSGYSVTRKGQGLPIKRRAGFEYLHLAPNFKGKLTEPFLVRAPFRAEEQDKPISLSHHEGQEFDYVVKGSLKIEIDGHTEVLSEGDSVLYDSGKGHGMIATGGSECLFLAMILKKPEEK